jgi:hypothetical protein
LGIPGGMRKERKFTKGSWKVSKMLETFQYPHNFVREVENFFE